MFKGLKSPEVFKLFSTINDISSPIFFFLSKFSKLFLDFASIDRGETATGNGFKLPLVISTSIKPYDFIVENKINIKDNKINLKIFIISLLTFPLHQNLIVTLSIAHIQLLVLLMVDTV